MCGGRLVARMILGHQRLLCASCGTVAYADPKVAAGTIPVWGDGRIVLARRSIEPGYGLWVFPGGFVERGETLEQGAIRETREEVGLEVALDRLLGVFSYPASVVVVVVYQAHVTGGVLVEESPECQEVRLFAPSEIPWGTLAFPSTRDGLRVFHQGL